MPRQILFASLLLITTTISAQNNDIKQLTKMNEDWLHSYITKDSATLDKIFADDIVLIAPNGSKMTKHEMISNASKQNLVSINIDSVNVRLITENTAIITAYTSFVLKIDDKDVNARNCYQDVYLKRNNRWQAVSVHVTLLK